MSKFKSPAEKKRLSLQKDRRNVYGECPTSSRKNIRRGKQRGHMEVRRAANEELRSLAGVGNESVADAVEASAEPECFYCRARLSRRGPTRLSEKCSNANSKDVPRTHPAEGLGNEL
jgi:hypothetical protein